jgi:hypothetical protein
LRLCEPFRVYDCCEVSTRRAIGATPNSLIESFEYECFGEVA